MRTFLLLVLLLLTVGLPAQEFSLLLEGYDCFYADPNSGNGMRTIELWFKPSQDYTSYNPEFAPLVCREQGYGYHNEHEFYLAVGKTGLPNPGHLRFCYLIDQWNYFCVYSDSNRWEKDVWYHVAGVIHPDSGMMMFINGKKQQQKAQYFDAAHTTSYNLAVGSWGYPPNGSNRYFRGTVDEIRISSIARYTKDFVPTPCIEPGIDTYTIACWCLEDGGGSFLEDLSGNGHDGTLVDGIWMQDDACDPTNTYTAEHQKIPGNILIAPNPAKAQSFVHITLNEPAGLVITMHKLGSGGSFQVFDKYAEAGQYCIPLECSELRPGLYVVSIATGSRMYTRKLLLL